MINNMADFKKDNDNKERDAHFWLNEIDNAGTREDLWYKEGEYVSWIYRSIDPNLKNSLNFSRDYGVRYNILFSNVELLKSVLFNNLPKPDIRRRWAKKTDKDEKLQTLYRTTAEVAERAVAWVFDSQKANDKMDKIIKDYLLPGRGVMWVSYEPEIKTEQNDKGEIVSEDLTDQKINLEYIYWQDYRQSWARTWNDTWWIARRHYLTRSDLISQFGSKGRKVKLTKKDDTENSKNDFGSNKDARLMAEVWEVWDKEKKKIHFVTEGLDEFLESRELPIDLLDVFPTPKPLQNITTTDDNIPISDFRAYKEQASELSVLCERISILTETLKDRFLYANQHSDSITKFSNLGDGEGLGIDISDIEAAGGLANVMYRMPLEQLMQVIIGLQQQKQSLIQEIYEVTGVADIMRAVSNPNETATAQKIKGQFGSFRLKKRQESVQNYIRDLIRIITEIVCEHFTADKLAEISGIDLPTMEEETQLILQGQQGQINKELNDRLALPTWEEVLQILRDDKLRSYTIDIESSATAFDEEQEDKQKAIEFISGANNMLTTSLEGAMQVPEILPLMRDLTMFGIKQFKIGRTLEESFENSFNNLEQKLTQMQQSQQGEGAGEQAKAQADMAKTQVAAQTAQMKIQADMQKEQMKLSAQVQRDQERLRFEQQKLKIESQKKEADINLQAQDLERKQEKDLADVEIAQEEVAIKQQEANRKDEELRVQAELKASELASQQAGDNVDINTNIAGDVGTLE
jgi:hypothetical protein